MQIIVRNFDIFLLEIYENVENIVYVRRFISDIFLVLKWNLRSVSKEIFLIFSESVETKVLSMDLHFNENSIV